MTDNELIEYYSKFEEKERLVDELKEFLEKRQEFLKNEKINADSDETKNSKIQMYLSFDKIYNSNKVLWYTGQIPESDFWKLKEELSNIDR